MKTARQIAEEIGVSKQAVHQKRKSKALSETLRQFTETVDGVVYFNIEGEKLLKEAFAKSKHQAVGGNNRQTSESVNTMIDTLLKQLEMKDKQLAELQQTVDRLTESLRLEQLKNLTRKQRLLMDGSDGRKWWRFWQGQNRN